MGEAAAVGGERPRLRGASANPARSSGGGRDPSELSFEGRVFSLIGLGMWCPRKGVWLWAGGLSSAEPGPREVEGVQIQARGGSHDEWRELS